MNAARVWAITRKQFLTLRHDPRSIGLILVAPILAMAVFGFAFGSDVNHVPVAIVNHDTGGEAAVLLSFVNQENLALAHLSFDTEARDRVTNAEAVAAIIFPADFTTGVTPVPGTQPQPGVGPLPGTPGSAPQAPPGTNITLFIDGSNSQQAAVVTRELASAARLYAESKGGSSPITIEATAAYAKDARFIDFFVPGIMAFAALLFTTILTLLAFVGERTNGTFDRLRVTPASEGEIVLGYVLAFGIIGAVQGIVLLTAALVLFNVLVAGSILLAALVIILLAIDSQAIGILMSALAQRESQAVMMLPFIIFPTFLLSGIFVPTESLPSWLRPVAYLLPPTWAVDAMRDVMLRGWGLDRIWPNLVVLVGFAVGFSLLATLGLKRARN